MDLWFDDGRIEIYEVMYPLLKKYPQIQPILAVVVAWVGAKGFMSKEQIQELIANGWKIASHSLRHYNLVETTTYIDVPTNSSAKSVDEHVWDEINLSSFAINDMFGIFPEVFVFPFNAFTPELKIIALDSYKAVRDPAILHFHCNGWYMDKETIRIKHASNPTRSNKELNDFKNILDGIRRR